MQSYAPLPFARPLACSYASCSPGLPRHSRKTCTTNICSSFACKPSLPAFLLLLLLLLLAATLRTPAHLAPGAQLLFRVLRRPSLAALFAGRPEELNNVLGHFCDFHVDI